jgi:ABC-type sugar transport system ATPase subunit
VIEVRGLVAQYGSFSLKQIDLTVSEGERFVLVGPSGAGKTLLLETMMGVKPPARGDILLAGKEITRLPPEERQFSYVPQDLALFPHLSVWRNVAFGLELRNTPRIEIEQRVREVASLLGIEGLLGRRSLRGLSGGEKQRVALARALVVQPRVLFLDEPFSALDQASAVQIHQELSELHQRLGFTMVLVTHDHEEAFEMADRLGVMMDGRLEQVGTPAELRDQPASVRLARFLLVENILAAECLAGGDAEGTCVCRAAGTELRVRPGPGLAPGKPVWVGVRARHLKLAATGSFAGTVHNVSPRSDRQLVAVRVGPKGEMLYVSCPDSHSPPAVAVGSRVHVEVDPERVLVFDEDGALVSRGLC